MEMSAPKQSSGRRLDVRSNVSHLHETETKGYNDTNALPTVHVQSPDCLEGQEKDHEVGEDRQAVIGYVDVCHCLELRLRSIGPRPPLVDRLDSCEIANDAADEACKGDGRSRVYHNRHRAVVSSEYAMVETQNRGFARVHREHEDQVIDPANLEGRITLARGSLEIINRAIPDRESTKRRLALQHLCMDIQGCQCRHIEALFCGGKCQLSCLAEESSLVWGHCETYLKVEGQRR